MSTSLQNQRNTHTHTHAHSHSQQNDSMGSSRLQMSRFVNIKQINSFEVDSTHTRRFTPPLFSVSSFSTSYLLYTSLHTLTLTHTLTHTHSHTANNNTHSPLPTHTHSPTHTHTYTYTQPHTTLTFFIKVDPFGSSQLFEVELTLSSQLHFTCKSTQ